MKTRHCNFYFVLKKNCFLVRTIIENLIFENETSVNGFIYLNKHYLENRNLCYEWEMPIATDFF